MTRQHRLELPPGVFHVTSRGVLGQTIFIDHYDYERFDSDLHRVGREAGWELCAYCLMPNHFHLLVETAPQALAAGMQRLKLREALHFNRRYRSGGHVFGRRYWCEAIEDEHRLREAARYVVLNPVRAGLCDHPSEWSWSSYRRAAGLEAPHPGDRKLLSEFGGDSAIYREFIEEAILRAGHVPRPGTVPGLRPWLVRARAG
jgi:REP element-mobilizing transposase RayT